jgi:hypothetical protein
MNLSLLTIVEGLKVGNVEFFVIQNNYETASLQRS